ncbi:MAG: hypothetical protein Q8M94_03540 [Ignavibacteria bacterium]|nr:hypothetical protein [Ignavibacteria bacterium]
MKKQGALTFLIIMIILVRIVYYFAQPDLCTDHISQMAMAQNFMDGHGFSFKYLDTQQQIYYKTHIQWPPLYPLLLASITFITANTLLSSLIIQIIVLLLLVFIWKRIFNLFKNFVTEEAYFYFISLLIISTSILNNINTILVLAILILSLSVYFMFAFLLLDKSKKLNLFLSSLFASLLFWTHYSYFLVAFYPAVVLFIIFLINKDKHNLYAAIRSSVVSFIVTSGVLIYNYFTTGFINYMDNPALWDAGFFPEHLLLTDPFFLNAFFKSSYLIDYLFSNNQHIFLPILFQLASLIILIVIVVLFLRLSKNKNLPFKKTSQLFIPFFVIIVLTISFLLYFTLHYHEIPRPGWTHIGDARYLTAVYLSIIAVVIMLVFVKADYLNKNILNLIKVVFIFLIFISLSINIYITGKEWGNYSFKTNNYVVPGEDLQNLFYNIKHELSKGNQPVFIDNDLTVRSFRISQYAGAAVINSNELKDIEGFPSNMVFFFILPVAEQYRDEDHRMLEWSEKFNLKIIGKVYTNLDLFRVTRH